MAAEAPSISSCGVSARLRNLPLTLYYVLRSITFSEISLNVSSGIKWHQMEVSVKRATQDPIDLDDFGRFSEPALLILISVADGPKHGYAMTEDIAAIADVRFGPGTLYGAIARLEGRGFIEALRSEDRRNPYRLTTLGEKALRARLASLQSVARIGQRRLANT